jgi:hypothetical protein
MSLEGRHPELAKNPARSGSAPGLKKIAATVRFAPRNAFHQTGLSALRQMLRELMTPEEV